MYEYDCNLEILFESVQVLVTRKNSVYTIRSRSAYAVAQNFSGTGVYTDNGLCCTLVKRAVRRMEGLGSIRTTNGQISLCCTLVKRAVRGRWVWAYIDNEVPDHQAQSHKTFVVSI